MDNQRPDLHHNNQGMALVSVMCIMGILFIMGTAALTNTATESKISQNYVRSIQAFYDCEAGIAIAKAKIDNQDTVPLVLDQWQTSPDSDFQYRYYITRDPNITNDPDGRIYKVIAEGSDQAQSSNRRIIAELKRLMFTGAIPAPVYCGSGENRGQPNTINGNSSCPAWADDGDPSNDTSLPCVATPNQMVSSTDPLDFDQDQLITDHSPKMEYDVPVIDLPAIAEFYRTRPPTMTAIPNGNGDIGSPTDLQVVYINGDEHIAGNRDGYGVLIITGDLHLSGQLHWNGLVIVLGNIIQSGGGSHGIQVTGAVLTPNDFSMRGNPDVQWCSDVITKVISETGDFPLEIISWQEDDDLSDNPLSLSN